MTERLTILARTYFRQIMLIQNNTTPEAWFIWNGRVQHNVWDGRTEQAGRDWAAANGLELEFVEPLGSEPILIEDEDDGLDLAAGVPHD